MAAVSKAERLVKTLRVQPSLRRIDDADLANLVAQGEFALYEAGDPILNEGAPADTVFFLITGAVRVFHQEADGTELLLKLFRAPAMFGEIEVLARRPYGEYVAAVGSAQVLRMPGEAFIALIKKRPAFAVDVLEDVSTRFCIAVQNLRAVAFSDVRARLADLFLDYAALSGEERPDGVWIATGLTQIGMARDLAVTRKAINATLKSLKKDGLIDKSEGHYIVLNMEGLRHLSSGTVKRTFSSQT